MSQTIPKENIRNISVIAHIDSGKTTTTDALVCRAGLISEKDAGEKCFTDGRKDEQERGITIKSTGVAMQFTVDNQQYKINLVDSPGHIDFSHEVSAALRLTDGSIVVMDAIDGVAVQTKTVLKQALAEQIKPILYINKMDRLIFELQLSPEEIYQRCVKMIDDVNNIISSYNSENTDNPDNFKVHLSPELGNVFFGSAYHGWGFGLKSFAKIFASRQNMDEASMMKKLWGEKYFDPKTKKITSSSEADGKPLDRTFCRFIIKPIVDLIKAINQRETTTYTKMFDSLGIKMSATELQMTEKELYKLALKRFIPLADALLDGIIYKLPSPAEAQKYRVSTLYSGPLDDECATAIKNCDETGPLVVYISKMIPMENGGRFYAFGRVYSGVCVPGQKVRVMGANYQPGKNGDYFENKAIQRVAKMIGGKAETCESVACGNTIAIVGIDAYLAKTGTLTTSPTGYPIKTMKFSVNPIVQVAVSPKSASDLTKLVEGMKKLSKSDPAVLCFFSETGDNIVAAVGELHLEICLEDLRQFVGAEIIVSQPIVPLRETVVSKSSQVCLSKSPNKHNRLYMTAEPIDSNLVESIMDKTISGLDEKARVKYLSENHQWDQNDARKIWAYGPEGSEESNVLVDCTKGLQYLSEIKDHVNSGFKEVTMRGVLCDEPIRGVRFNIQDVTLHADTIHRGAGQITPTARRCMFATMLTSEPAVMEPMYLVEVQVPESCIGTIYSAFQNKRGEVISQEPSIGEMVNMKANLPVLESFGFCEYLREQTSGQAFIQMIFDHWKVVPGNPLDKTSFAGKIVTAARVRKGLTPDIPALSNYLDKL